MIQQLLYNFKIRKKMELKNLNLVELNAQEVQETEGGWDWISTGSPLIDFTLNPTAMWIEHQIDDFVDGFNTAIND